MASTTRYVWRPFGEAREFVRSLSLRSAPHYVSWAKSGDRPRDIPSDPRGVYADCWQSWGDFLGTGSVATKGRTYRDYESASTWARSQGFRKQVDWDRARKARTIPADIPGCPWVSYRESWRGWGEFLGTGFIATRYRQHRDFESAREWVRAQKFSSGMAYRAASKEGRLPRDIPADPAAVYSQQWRGMGDWLGSSTVHPMFREYLDFEVARATVRALGIRTTLEYAQRSKAGELPSGIPATPNQVYSEHWKGMRDWLGTAQDPSSLQTFRDFESARSYVRSLGLRDIAAWKVWARTEARPADVPINPDRAYSGHWRGWRDWLGTAPGDRRYRDFEAARMNVRSRGFRNEKEYVAAAKAGHLPADIPANPRVAYKGEFKGMIDWLGSEESRRKRFVDFETARALVRSEGIPTSVVYLARAKAGLLPDGLPRSPATIYRGGWQGWGDFLGTGSIAVTRREFRDFESARTYARKLGLYSSSEWQRWCQSNGRPADIPTDPAHVYRERWQGWRDWLGATPSERPSIYRDFESAREYVRTLDIDSVAEYRARWTAGSIPRDIPAKPEVVYRERWSGWGDWIGQVKAWTRNALVGFIRSLEPALEALEPREILVILAEGGALGPLRKALGGARPSEIIRLFRSDGVRTVVAKLEKSDSTQACGFTFNDQEALVVDVEQMLFSENATAHAPLSYEDGVARLTARELHAVDKLADLPRGVDCGTADYLVAGRVSALWELYVEAGLPAVDAVLDGEGGEWFRTIRDRFRAEVDAVESLEIPHGWALVDDLGRPALPNAMQRRAAWQMRERRRVGNWSGTGAGKTLAAVLASRVTGARLTLVIANLATIAGWGEQIRAAYPDSEVAFDVASARATRATHTFLVLNYEKFQSKHRFGLVDDIFALEPECVVLDEVQFVKQRCETASKRRRAVDALLSRLAERNPGLYVMGMSATPVINSLAEATRLLELVTGESFSGIGTTSTVENALAVHAALMRHGFRYRPRYEMEFSRRVVCETRNDLVDRLQESASVLAVEQTLVEARLDAVRHYLRRGVVVYTQYVDGVVDVARHYMEAMGLTVGLYTGTDKSGLEQFKAGETDVLIGSSAAATGLDGLQKCADRLVMLSLPWTGAQYEQAIGRLRRQGSLYRTVEVIIPQISIVIDAERWSWDEARLRCVELKLSLADCAVDGHLPEALAVDPDRFLLEGRKALELWIDRVERAEEKAA